MAPRGPLMSVHARTIEDLLGLDRYSLRGVERRANGDFALMFRTQRVGDSWPRVLRIPAKRVFGYMQRSPVATDRDVRARRQANARRMALWLFDRVGPNCPVVARALWDSDLTGVDELRAAILALVPPDYVLFLWTRAA
jgi:hypothetical protein